MNKLFILLVVLVAAALPAGASAHELVKDQIGDAGAIFHVNPDDDVTAGKQVTLFFDISGKSIAPKSEAHLIITGEQGAVTEIKAKVADSSISADYTFPRPGLYDIRLEIARGGKTTHVFAQSQSVGGAAANTAPSWARIGIAATVFGAGFIVLSAFKRRKAIRKYSTM